MSLGFAAIAESPIAAGDDSLGLAIASPTGVSATSALGSVTVVPQGVFALTGVEATTAVGTVNASAQFIAQVTGVEAVASLDEDYVVSGSAPVSVTGEEATSALQVASAPAFTAEGDAQLSTTQKKFGSASLLLDGTGDYVSKDTTSELTAGDEWTVEFWVYSSTLTSQDAYVWDIKVQIMAMVFL